jgi:hypothetical protein
MTSILKKARWSPYAVGTGVAVLSWVTFALMNKALGVSTTMVRATGFVEGLVSETYIELNGYFFFACSFSRSRLGDGHIKIF